MAQPGWAGESARPGWAPNLEADTNREARMPGKEFDVRPVTHITADAIGPAGQRVFYLQGWEREHNVALLVEKSQIQLLAVAVDRFLEEVHQKYPQLSPEASDYEEADMHISPPVEPLFRGGEMGLGYDVENDLLILQVRELVEEEEGDPEQGRLVRFWCSRSQLRALARWGLELASRGRPSCPMCGEPVDPEGHLCPKGNGHKRLT